MRVILIILGRVPRCGAAKDMIYDCFTFFNELDLLEIRLNELNDTVDRFVLVEATKNHQGKDKPLYFNENKERFSRFSDKIIHVIVDKYPENPSGNTWVFEHHQRNMIREGLKDCRPDDVIIISDLDEIPDKKKIMQYKDVSGIKIFRQRTFYYFINCVSADDVTDNGGRHRWHGSVMLDYADIGASIQELRETSLIVMNLRHPKLLNRVYWHLWTLKNVRLKGKKLVFINDGGWHFSYLGGVERIIKKLEAFAHNEYNKEKYKDPKKIEEAINNGEDIFGRNFRYKFIGVDNSFPKYLREHLDRYSQFVKR
jgi:beta-1,4-mannosyl-glycoprotein beta-1,4-N-acetylglucosaminyltransferase